MTSLLKTFFIKIETNLENRHIRIIYISLLNKNKLIIFIIKFNFKKVTKVINCLNKLF